MGGRKSPFPITLAIGLYNSLYYRTSRLYYRTSRDLMQVSHLISSPRASNTEYVQSAITNRCISAPRICHLSEFQQLHWPTSKFLPVDCSTGYLWDKNTTAINATYWPCPQYIYTVNLRNWKPVDIIALTSRLHHQYNNLPNNLKTLLSFRIFEDRT